MKKKPDETSTRLSLAALRKQSSRTDWQRVAALTDAEITAAAESDPDAPLPPKTESPAQAGLLHDRHTRYRKPHRHTARLHPNSRSHPAFKLRRRGHGSTADVAHRKGRLGDERLQHLAGHARGLFNLFPTHQPHPWHARLSCVVRRRRLIHG